MFLAGEDDIVNVTPVTTPVGLSTNQSSSEQATGTLPSSASSEQNSRLGNLNMLMYNNEINISF